MKYNKAKVVLFILIIFNSAADARLVSDNLYKFIKDPDTLGSHDESKISQINGEY